MALMTFVGVAVAIIVSYLIKKGRAGLLYWVLAAIVGVGSAYLAMFALAYSLTSLNAAVFPPGAMVLKMIQNIWIILFGAGAGLFFGGRSRAAQGKGESGDTLRN
jgi:hypothetical protein